jgi:hypothetical protein
MQTVVATHAYNLCIAFDERRNNMTINELLRWISSGVTVGAVGTGIAFVVSIFQFLSVRKRESREREFDKYHSLIERLVSPDKSGGVFLDRQIAVVFELRNFPRYYDCTQRILKGLKLDWQTQKAPSRLIDEIDLTLNHIKRKT